MKRKLLQILALIANLSIVFLVGLGTYQMMSGASDGAALTARGLLALRYFTVQSNLLMGVAALVYAIALFRALRRDRATVPVRAQVFLLTATASVGLTFLVVAGFFVQVLHAKDMFVGANLWFHLVVPLLSIVCYVLLDRFARMKKRALLFVAVPMLLYGLFYAANCMINGVGDYSGGGDLNDWYWFLYWGYPVGVAFFVGLCAVTVGLGALLRWLNQIRIKVPNSQKST